MTRKKRHQIQQKSFKNLMFQTNLMREESFLTDFQLICEDKEFLVHKVILSAASPYFKEYFKKNSQKTSLQIDFINSNTLETVLMFIYQGRINLRNQSQSFLKDLLEAFIILKIPLIYNHCLENLLGNQQFLSQWNTVEQLKSDLIKQTYMKYLHQNMKTLKTTEGFLNLSYKKIKALFKFPSSEPVNQEEKVSAILLWIKHQKLTRMYKINDLLATIDFKELSNSLLLKLKNEPLLKNNSYFNMQCTKLFFSQLQKPEAFKISETSNLGNKSKTERKSRNSDTEKNSSKTTKSLKSENSQMNQKNSQTDSNENSNKILESLNRISFSKYEKEKSLTVSKRVFVYDGLHWNRLLEFNLDTENWTEVKDDILLHLFSRAKGSTICSFDNFIYFFCGKANDGSTINQCFQLDIIQKKITEIKTMNKSRYNATAVKLNDFIYIVGGECGNSCFRSAMHSCERYNLTTKSWGTILDLPFHLFNWCVRIPVLAINGRLCLIGKSNLIWFDPQSEQWSIGEILPANYPQHLQSSSAVNIHENIFIVLHGLNKIFCFNLIEKTWNTYTRPDPCGLPIYYSAPLGQLIQQPPAVHYGINNYYSSCIPDEHESNNCIPSLLPMNHVSPIVSNGTICIFSIQKSNVMEFLILDCQKSYIFRPPNYWKSISPIPFFNPMLFSVGE